MSTGAAGILAGPAAIADGAGNFPIDTIEVDPPAAGEVRVAMAAAGVCHTDYASLHWPGPLVPGHEGAGHVESVGTDVRGLVPGQSAKGVLRIGEGSGGSDGSRDVSPRPGPVATSRWRHAATTPKAQEPAA